MNQLSKERARRARQKEKRIRNGGLCLRWLFLMCIVSAYFLVSDDRFIKVSYICAIAITLIYNILVTSHILKSDTKKKSILRFIVYLDVIIISVFSYLTGGVNSDLYILLIFIIGFYGINKNMNHTLRLSFFCVITYTAFGYLAGKNTAENLYLLRLITRDFFILLTGFGISAIIYEIKKYNQLHKRDFKLARTDNLTGLANRHYFEQKLKEEVNYVDLSGTVLNILIFDLDNFKKFNDTYGHTWGDKLISLFSDIIKNNINKSGIPVRYGGDEFLLLVKELNIDIVKSFAERIREQLEQQKIYVGDGDNRKKVTVSCGIAQYPKHSGNIKEVIDYADKALYHAKNIGKNLVVSYDDIELALK